MSTFEIHQSCPVPTEYVELLLGFKSCGTYDELKTHDNLVCEEVGKVMQAQIGNEYSKKTASVTCPICGAKLKVSMKKGVFDFTKTAERHFNVFTSRNPCMPMFDVLRKRSKHIEENIRINNVADNYYTWLLKGWGGKTSDGRLIFLSSPFYLTVEKPGNNESRTYEDLLKAGERLIAHGFVDERIDDTRAWTYTTEKHIVFANPSHVGIYHFEVWEKSIPKKVLNKDILAYRVKTFDMGDSALETLKDVLDDNVPVDTELGVAV